MINKEDIVSCRANYAIEIFLGAKKKKSFTPFAIVAMYDLQP